MLKENDIETVCCLYRQKKDFISVPYEPRDAEYLSNTKRVNIRGLYEI